MKFVLLLLLLAGCAARPVPPDREYLDWYGRHFKCWRTYDINVTPAYLFQYNCVQVAP